MTCVLQTTPIPAHHQTAVLLRRRRQLKHSPISAGHSETMMTNKDSNYYQRCPHFRIGFCISVNVEMLVGQACIIRVVGSLPLFTFSVVISRRFPRISNIVPKPVSRYFIPLPVKVIHQSIVLLFHLNCPLEQHRFLHRAKCATDARHTPLTQLSTPVSLGVRERFPQNQLLSTVLEVRYQCST